MPHGTPGASRQGHARRWLFGVLFGWLILAAVPSAAQQVRTLRIVDGEVFIDDRLVAPEELPDGFHTEGVTAYFSFSSGGNPPTIALDGRKSGEVAAYFLFSSGGDPVPIIRLHGRLYKLEGSQLLDAAEHDDPEFMPGPPPEDYSDLIRPPVPPDAPLFDQKAQVLLDRAQRMQEMAQRFQGADFQVLQNDLEDQLRALNIHDFQQLAHEMSIHAIDAARMARDLPYVKQRSYLADVQRTDRQLYERLIDEQRLEAETVGMAYSLRYMEDGEERDRGIEGLREQLDEMFELKQENRRREVEQIEGRLEGLRKNLAERERRRDEIVDRRLRQLLREDGADWTDP